MNDVAIKRRPWVKNAAIIFLSVMLVLTFFSNTIMNFSLPEVAAQYAQPGTITTQVRGTGTVKANMAYKVEIDQTRVIDRVAVKQGDAVEAGQILFYLTDTESDELKTALKALDDAELAYQQKLLGLTDADYFALSQNIKRAKEELAALQKDRSTVTDREKALENAKAAVRSAEDRVDALASQISSLQAQIENISTNNHAILYYKSLLDNATQAKKAAEDRVKAIEAQMGTSVETAQSTVTTIQRNLEDLNRKLSYAQEDLGKLSPGTDEYIALNRSIEEQIATIQRTTIDLAAAQDVLNKVLQLNNQLMQAQQEVNNAQTNLNQAQTNYDNTVASESAGLKSQLDNLSAQKKAADRALTDATKTLTDASANVSPTAKELEAQIKAKQLELEGYNHDLAKAQKEGNVQEALSDLELQRLQKTIDEQKKLVESLQKKDTGATIAAQYAGVVTSLHVIAGQTANKGDTLADIEVKDKGYTLEFAVTNDQANLIRTGDTATINNWWYSELKATVTGLRNDPEKPGRGRIVTLTLTGDVTVGQSLSVTLGQRGSNYDIVVPNSAIREDNNGKFILIVESKPSPLGNRYIATRADIQVRASDDNNSAISGALYGYEFVITTSTKPIVAGQQVRLVES